MENNYKKRSASQNLVFGTLICSLLGINTVLEIVHSTEDGNPDGHVHNERTYEPSKINRGDSLFILTQEDIERIVEHVRHDLQDSINKSHRNDKPSEARRVE